MKRKTTIQLVAVFLLLVFTWDAISKLIWFQTFRSQLDKSPYTSGYSTLIAPVLPVAELLIAALLIRDRTRLSGLFCSFFLVSLFTVHLLAMLSTGYQLPCACGEMIQQLSLGKHIIFNLAIIMMAATAIILYGRVDRRRPGLI
jgi:hypothetical protein